MECPKCGLEIDDKTIVCPNCKKVLKVVCPICKTIIAVKSTLPLIKSAQNVSFLLKKVLF